MRGTGNVAHRASELLDAYETKEDEHPGTDVPTHTRRYSCVHTMPDEAEESAAPQGSEFHEVLPLISPT